MISTGELRKGLTMIYGGDLMRIVEFQHVKQGRGSAYVRLTLRNVRTGATVNTTVQAGEQSQLPATDWQYDLGGVEAVWRPQGDGKPWSGWLPHLDLHVAQALTQASVDHDDFWARSRQPGELLLRTTLDLKDMLRPAVQPDSRIDHDWPAERVTLTLRSRTAFTIKTAGATSRGTSKPQMV